MAPRKNAFKSSVRSVATIGYEGVGFGDFLQTLRAAHVRHVLDVRELPLSRRAGFSKNPLKAGLAEGGIEYTHLKGLGTPKDGRLAAQNGRMEEFRSIFSAHMKTKIAKDELLRAAELVRHEKCCLLCFEADPECCHRSVVARALNKKTGLKIVHLHVMPI